MNLPHPSRFLNGAALLWFIGPALSPAFIGCTHPQVDSGTGSAPDVTTETPECGDFSVPGQATDWGWDVSLANGVLGFYMPAAANPTEEVFFGVAGPLSPGGAETFLGEACALDAPPTAATAFPQSCRPVVDGWVVLDTGADPDSYDIATETVFGAAVEDELTYVVVSAVDEQCWAFGRDTCIYEEMACAHPYSYAGGK